MNKTLGKVRGGCWLGLYFSTMLGFAGSAYAAEDAVGLGKFELTIMQATVGGNEIFAGDFSAAVEKINTSISGDSKYTKSANLCAAYTAMGEFSSAQPHCKAALTMSRSSRYGVLSLSKPPTSRRNMQAMALNNLGVWHALQGDAEQAEAHFKNAANRSKELMPIPSRNIEVLELRIGPATVASS